MADRAIRYTSDFAPRFARAKIRCLGCGHSVIVDGEQMLEMFPVMMKLEVARYRLRCKACHGRMPEIEVLARPPRD